MPQTRRLNQSQEILWAGFHQRLYMFAANSFTLVCNINPLTSPIVGFLLWRDFPVVLLSVVLRGLVKVWWMTSLTSSLFSDKSGLDHCPAAWWISPELVLMHFSLAWQIKHSISVHPRNTEVSQHQRSITSTVLHRWVCIVFLHTLVKVHPGLLWQNLCGSSLGLLQTAAWLCTADGGLSTCSMASTSLDLKYSSNTL